MALGVHGERPRGEQAAGLFRGLGGALAQGGPDAGQKLLDGEGLGDVIVGPHVQAGDLIHHRIPGGEHDNGQLALLPQAAQHLHARQGGKHDVQQHQVVFSRQGAVQSGPAVEGLIHLVSLVLQLQLHHAGQFLLILHQKDLFGHAAASSHRIARSSRGCARVTFWGRPCLARRG